MSRRKKTVKPIEGEIIFTLDIANNTGFCFGTPNDGPLIYGKYSSDESLSLAERLLKFSQWLSRTINKLPEMPTTFIIEMPYLGKNVLTFAVLNKFIAIAEREIFRIAGRSPIFLTPRVVKTTLRLPKANNTNQHKKNMVKFINQFYGLDLKYAKYNKERHKVSDDDTADAIGMFIAYCIKRGYFDDLSD